MVNQVINEKADADNFWKAVIIKTLEEDHRKNSPFEFNKHLQNGNEIPRPQNTSILLSGNPENQSKPRKIEWHATFENIGAGFTVVEYDDKYECYIDPIDSLKDAAGNIKKYVPVTVPEVPTMIQLSNEATIYFFKKKNGMEKK